MDKFNNHYVILQVKVLIYRCVLSFNKVDYRWHFLTCLFLCRGQTKKVIIEIMLAQSQEVIMFTVLNAGHWAQQYETLGERAFLSITMTLVGISIVVFILTLLSAAVSLISKGINRRDKKNAPPADSAPVEMFSLPQVAPQAGDLAKADADQAVVAVIAAAVTVMLSGQSGPQAGFRIRRIRRV
jgi:sodium pump decarboxylase gamma subunit